MVLALLDRVARDAKQAERAKAKAWGTYAEILQRGRLGKSERADANQVPGLLETLGIDSRHAELHTFALDRHADEVARADKHDAAQTALQKSEAAIGEQHQLIIDAEHKIEGLMDQANAHRTAWIQADAARDKVKGLEARFPTLFGFDREPVELHGFDTLVCPIEALRVSLGLKD